MKKILAILMTLMLVIGLCACGNETANETNNTNTNVENTEQGETVSFFEETGALIWKTPYNGVYNLTETPTQKTEYFEAVITKVEANETDDAHNEGSDKDHVAVEGFIGIVDQEGKDDHRQHIADHGTDRTPSRKRCSVSIIRRNER